MIGVDTTGAPRPFKTPAELPDFMQAEAKKWGHIIRQNNIKGN
jgi:hypothetical protein